MMPECHPAHHIQPSENRISVIVPVYNAEPFLQRCLESVLAQTHPQIELILVDDGSTDASMELCRHFAAEHPGVCVLSQKNRGPAAARNAGVKATSGEFVFFLDADDCIASDTLAALLAAQKRHGTDLVLGGFCKEEADGRCREQQISFAPDLPPFTGQETELSPADMTLFVRHFLKHPSNHLVSYCWGRLYRLQTIRQHGLQARESMRLFEDFVYNLDCMRYMKSMSFVNRPLYTYVMHDQHVSASMATLHAESLVHDMEIFRTHTVAFLRDLEKLTNTEEEEKAVGHALIHYAIIFLVRSCWRLGSSDSKGLYSEIRKFLKAPIVQNSLRHYQVLPGYSRIVPALMRWRLVRPLMHICHYKACKRYGRPKV